MPCADSGPRIRKLNGMKTNIVKSLGELLHFAAYDIRMRYCGTAVGVSWSVIQPLIQSITLVVVFGILAGDAFRGTRYQDFSFALFYFSGYCAWSLFADIVGRGSGIVRAHSNLIRNSTIRLSLFPLAGIVTAFIPFIAVFVLCIALLMLEGSSITPYLMYVPLHVIPFALLSYGVASLVAAFAMYIKDIDQVVGLVLGVLFWITPVLYTPEMIQQRAPELVSAVLLDANPLSWAVTGVRSSILGTWTPETDYGLVKLWCVGAAIAVIGRAVYRRLSPAFAEIL